MLSAHVICGDGGGKKTGVRVIGCNPKGRARRREKTEKRQTKERIKVHFRRKQLRNTYRGRVKANYYSGESRTSSRLEGESGSIKKK